MAVWSRLADAPVEATLPRADEFHQASTTELAKIAFQGSGSNAGLSLNVSGAWPVEVADRSEDNVVSFLWGKTST